MKHGVYVLENPDHDGIVKIGYTDGEMSRRLKGINTTGVLNDWTVSYFYSCDTPYDLEQYLHQRFSVDRVKSRREMFYTTVAEVRAGIAAAGEIASQKAFNKNQHKVALKESIEKQRTDDFYNKTKQSILSSTTYENAADNYRVITNWRMETRLRLGTVDRYLELQALAGKIKGDLSHLQKADPAPPPPPAESCITDYHIGAGTIAGALLTPVTGGLSMAIPAVLWGIKKLSK